MSAPASLLPRHPRLARAARALALSLALFALALVAIPGLAIPIAGAQGAGDADALGALLARFAAMPGLEAEFREEKRIALLRTPLVNEGTLHFSPPDRLARHVLRPSPSSVLVQGGRMRVADASGERELELDTQPLLRAFVDPFLGLLGGDRRALERAYRLRFLPSSEADAWVLELRPHQPALGRILRHIRLEGQGLALSRLRVEEQSGDVSETTFRAVDSARRYSATELRLLFSLPRP
ncbi:MAG: outer membrane lipoprotein carrier protein LolA [Myxococcales bacterium]|nr:outer membrane lipoprotein carrier protein LolA [Myxococcales bacterium]